MDNYYRWVQIGETTYQLEDDDSLLATLAYNKREDLWYLVFDHSFINTVFLPKSIDKLKMDAIKYIRDCSKITIEDYQKIQHKLLKFNYK